MITDTEIRSRGLRDLAESLGDVEAERFIALIQREPFDFLAIFAHESRSVTVRLKTRAPGRLSSLSAAK